MKKSLKIAMAVVCLVFAGCKGNPNTTSGDSTGTGAGGARVPGNVTKDTTKNDTLDTASKATVKQ